MIFENGTSGTLALLGDDGYPYTVPINYVYSDGNIYFHSATEGHKIDAIRNYDKASFCVVDADDVVPEEFTTYFRSAIAFGRMKLIEDGDRKHSAIQMLAEKYSSDQGARIEHVINQYSNVLTMIELEIEHMTGKEAIQLVNAKKTV